MWSRSLPVEGAARLLTKMGLLDTGIIYACEGREFEFALELCNISGRSADDVHMKIAMDLEDEGKVNIDPIAVGSLKKNLIVTLFAYSSTKPKWNSCWPTNRKKPF